MENIFKLLSGGNTFLCNDGKIEVCISWEESPCDLDISNFMVGDNGKVPSDDYMIFYNQHEDPENSTIYNSPSDKIVKFLIDLDKLSTSIKKCVFTATLFGEGTFRDVKGCKLTVIIDNIPKVVYELGGSTEERALVIAEVYKHSSGFKIKGVGRGFNGGLKPLAEAHGVIVDDVEEDQVEQVKQANSVDKLNNGSIVEKSTPKKVNLTKIDMLKEKLVVTLEKKNIHSEKARVVFVMDGSGSMRHLYRKGTVQRAFERSLAVAACFDDDGVMDVFFFADKSWRAPSVTVKDFDGYVERNHKAPGKSKPYIGYGNNEPAVMKDLIKKYTVEEKMDDIPTYVLFFSDGGIYEDKAIAKLLKESSDKNIFWQFIGIGDANFGILKKLDDLPGRTVDNADFFALSDLDSVSDEELYERMFNEFPEWLKQVRQNGILK